jgi:hypothetical protein
MDGSEKGQDAELLRLYAVQWRILLFFIRIFFMGVDGYLCRSSLVFNDRESALVRSGGGPGLKFPVRGALHMGDGFFSGVMDFYMEIGYYFSRDGGHIP